MSSHTVSIIIPTYNEGQYLPECLNSIFKLDYAKENIEIIVVDNGSTDRTREIAISSGVKVLRDDSSNVSGLRNLGASHSEGDILAFVDADCIVSKEWLKKASRYFDDNDVAAWGGPPVPMQDAGWIAATWFALVEKTNQVEYVDWIGTVDLFVRGKQFLSIGGFNESLVSCEDVDLCYKLRKYGKIVSDSRIEVVHLREASTIKEFIKKEMWRGRSNWRGIRSHGLLLHELPSLSIPLYFGFFLPTLLLGFLVSLNTTWLFSVVLFYLLPTLAVMFKLRRKKIRLVTLLRLLFLVQVYFFSRTVAVFKKDKKNTGSESANPKQVQL